MAYPYGEGGGGWGGTHFLQYPLLVVYVLFLVHTSWPHFGDIAEGGREIAEIFHWVSGCRAWQGPILAFRAKPCARVPTDTQTVQTDDVVKGNIQKVCRLLG